VITLHAAEVLIHLIGANVIHDYSRADINRLAQNHAPGREIKLGPSNFFLFYKRDGRLSET
jgi:hypothetical protein